MVAYRIIGASAILCNILQVRNDERRACDGYFSPGQSRGDRSIATYSLDLCNWVVGIQKLMILHLVSLTLGGFAIGQTVLK